MADGEWCLIESDPSIFTEMIAGFGVSGMQVEEMYSLDDDSLRELRQTGPSTSVLGTVPEIPVHGIIFLFRWHTEEKTAGTLVTDDRQSSMFFAKQVIRNACATQAILSVLLNTTHSDVSLGADLSEFKANTFSFDPSMKGLSLTNMDSIRKVHNSFARPTQVEVDPSMQQKEEEPFHFVAYVPIGDRLYELDGLKEGPLDLGKITDKDWLKDLRPILQTRMQAFTGNEIRFNLMAIVSDRVQHIKQRIAQLGVAESAAAVNEKEMCQIALADENAKLRRYKTEVIRHRHNYFPLIMEILKILAAKGELGKMVDEASERKSLKRKSEKQS